MNIIQNLPDTEYHARTEIGSTTAVKGIENEPLLIEMIKGNHRVEDKPCFVSGRLMHLAVLEPDKFASLVVSEGPINERTGEPYGRGTKTFAKWQDENPHLTFVDEWIKSALERMPKDVADVLKDGESETSVFTELFKCRPDFWNRSTKIFYDLKSLQTGGGSMERAIEKAIRIRSYWFTTAWYRRVIKMVTGEDHRCRLIFVEKEFPHRWRIVDLDFDYINIGDSTVDRIMDKITTNTLGADEEIFFQATAPEYLTGDDE